MEDRKNFFRISTDTDFKQDTVEAIVKKCVAKILNKSESDIDYSSSFKSLGIDAKIRIQLFDLINEELGCKLLIENLFDYRNVKGLIDGIVAMPKLKTENFLQPKEEITDDIAIIGMSGRFIGCDNIEKFWKSLIEGKCLLKSCEREGWMEAVCSSEVSDSIDKDNGVIIGLLDDIKKFDPLFFNISPKEAERMDPQQRIILEEAYRAFEDSGYSDESISGKKVGVFIGTHRSDYREVVLTNETTTNMALLGNETSIEAGRISYFFNLKGPNVAVDTACSSSLVAIHQACESLKNHGADMALAGGICVESTAGSLIMLTQNKMISKNRGCKAFDDSADGISVGEGVGLFVLKRLADAERDKDHIYAVIKGVATNCDGKTKGINAPSSLSQESLLKDVYFSNGIDPNTISYIEAHGTGTRLGDMIEIHSLTKAFEMFTKEKQFCAIGSCKSNIGHTLMASGAAGMIKIVKSLENKVIPPHIGMEKQNRFIDFENSPFYVNKKLINWETCNGVPRRAGISSFGFSGTNCHVIVEEYAKKYEDRRVQHSYYYPVSARTEDDLHRKLLNLLEWTKKEENIHVHPGDLSFTLTMGRKHFKIRCAFVADSLQTLSKQLEKVCKGEQVIGYIPINRVDDKDLTKIVIDNMEKSELESPECEKILLEIANQYVQGAFVDFQQFFEDSYYHRISLPTYPFCGKEYWVKQENSSIYLGSPSLKVSLNNNRNNVKEEVIQPVENKLPIKEKNELIIDVKDYIVDNIVCILSELLSLESDDIDLTTPYVEFGIDSILAVDIVKKVNESLGTNVRNTELFNYSTIDSLSDYIIENYKEEVMNNMSHKTKSDDCNKDVENMQEKNDSQLNKSMDIAIVGIAGQFPDAANIDEYWDNLKKGRNSIREISRWNVDSIFAPKSDGTGGIKCRYGGFLSDIDKFDPLFFGISPIEAEYMDPQQRMFLEETWKALEDAGYSDRELKEKKCGIYAAIGMVDYSEILREHGMIGDPYSMVGVSEAILASRLSYFLDLKGPSVTVNTACSSALTAIHLASQSIINGECDIAIAGSAWVMSSPRLYELTGSVGMLSNTGQCHTFDESADGFVPGEAVGAIVLKRLDEAVKDGNHIYGVLMGSGINQDGKTNGITAPSATSQADLEKSIYSEYNINPEEITYIEAHGTGTKLGDPIEVQALTSAFRNFTDKKNYCAIGSSKTNIGHAQAASGIASIIKLLLCLDRKTLVPSLNYERKNEMIDFENSPFYVNDMTKEWFVEDGKKRIGGVSAFGFSGTNAHIIIQEAEHYNENSHSNKSWYMIPVTGKTEEALNRNLHALYDWLLNENNEVCIDDISYTLLVGRSHFQYRKVYLVRSIEDLVSKLLITFNGKQCDDCYSGKVPVRKKDESTMVRKGLSIIQDIYNKNQTNEQMHTKFVILSEIFTGGYLVDWKLLFSTEKHHLLRMPNYSFEKEHIWASGEAKPVTIPEVMLSKKNVTEVIVNVEKTEKVIEKKISPKIKRQQAEDIVLDTISKKLKLSKERIDMELSLMDYGFDSISLKEFSSEIAREYQVDINPTVFFTFENINEFIDYFASVYDSTVKNNDQNEEDVRIVEDGVLSVECASEVEDKVIPIKDEQVKVAIVGISSLLPGADSPEEYWNNLIAGVSGITSIPTDRWNNKGFDGISKFDNLSPNKGGFINNVKCFDAKFFGISPYEAEFMDPQQRKLLEVVWKAVEDSGHNIKEWSGKEVGVFIGSEECDYSVLMNRYGISDLQCGTGVAKCMIANRISYMFNLRGPSEVIDTACSSALAAINRAVNAIILGECEAAIAGGARLILSPMGLQLINEMGIGSPDGVCRTFDKDANGYVKGEGIGALVLKPLTKAQADGDYIYGVIIGNAENHGGKARSITAPNSEAQANLILKAMQRANVTPDSITYVEAHGTGTELGDPIEIEGLNSAFQQWSTQKNVSIKENSCGIGSVKPAIGHLESMSGFASVIKVLYSMKNRMLPATQNFRNLNPYIRLNGTPFYIVDKNMPWRVTKNEAMREQPLRAGISSFGFGGSNVHLILENSDNLEGNYQDDKYLFCLSAQDEFSLKEYITSICSYLKEKFINKYTDNIDTEAGNQIILGDIKVLISRVSGCDSRTIEYENNLEMYGFEDETVFLLIDSINVLYQISLPYNVVDCKNNIEELVKIVAVELSLQGKLNDVNKTDNNILSANIETEESKEGAFGDFIYTYLVGRVSLPERIAIVTSDAQDLMNKLVGYLEGKNNSSVLYGSSKHKSENTSLDEQKLLWDSNQLSKLAQCWIEGSEIDWNVLLRDSRARRMPCPTYPFKKTQYWINIEEASEKSVHNVKNSCSTFLDSNISTLRKQTFVKEIDPKDYYLQEHVVMDGCQLPGAVYIEMALESGVIAAEKMPTGVRDIYWMLPIRPSKEEKLFIDLTPEESNVQYNIYTYFDREEIVASKGTLCYETFTPLEWKEPVYQEMEQLDVSELYRTFAKNGIVYGEAFQTIKEAWKDNKNECCQTMLELDDKHLEDDCILHPLLLDGVFQSVALLSASLDSKGVFVPFSISEIRVHDKLPSKCLVTAKIKKIFAESAVFDIFIKAGNSVFVEIFDFTIRNQRQTTHNSRNIAKMNEADIRKMIDDVFNGLM